EEDLGLREAEEAREEVRRRAPDRIHFQALPGASRITRLLDLLRPLRGTPPPVAPARAVAEGARARDVPRVRRHEEDLARRDAEGARSQLVDLRRGLVALHLVHREEMLEHAFEPGRAD